MDSVGQLGLEERGLGEPDPTMVITEGVAIDDEFVSSPKPDVVESDTANRTSVFHRLAIDERLKFQPKDMDFAKAVGSQDSTVLSFFPLVNKTHSSVRIPTELAKEVMKTHKSTLFGYFLGPRLHFQIVEKAVKEAWSKFGFSSVMMNNNGIYFFKFNDFGGSNQVVEAGPLMI
ncbi:hypothetical protein OSB04_021211 [Centaurea solstitialis]|uniref:DUF4283 domain-containing protein n=1 Tax=Centaurea solstitialis TaxID=347529 RepID=A0AA38SU41_9ASTR|nr:hypothetical protein OSB04_021211 [Centaurea solstitialis]